jgi:DUF4097 and DUF4098 domain-containing protein YvlB
LITGMGDIRIAQCAELKARTGYGNLSVERAIGPVDLVTASGDLHLGQAGAGAVLRNSNGPVEIGQVNGVLKVKAGNGPIVVHQADSDVAAKASSGPITLERVTRGAVTAATAAGTIRIGVAEGSAAWLDLHTALGSVRSELEPAAQPVGAGPSVKISGRTAAGDITISRAGPG